MAFPFVECCGASSGVEREHGFARAKDKVGWLAGWEGGRNNLVPQPPHCAQRTLTE